MSEPKDPMELLKEQNTDAMEWAKSFCQTLKDNPDIVIDEGLMVGWFANPIMCMHDKNKTKSDQLAEKVEYEIVILKHAGANGSAAALQTALMNFRGEK